MAGRSVDTLTKLNINNKWSCSKNEESEEFIDVEVKYLVVDAKVQYLEQLSSRGSRLELLLFSQFQFSSSLPKLNSFGNRREARAR